MANVTRSKLSQRYSLIKFLCTYAFLDRTRTFCAQNLCNKVDEAKKSWISLEINERQTWKNASLPDLLQIVSLKTFLSPQPLTLLTLWCLVLMAALGILLLLEHAMLQGSESHRFHPTIKISQSCGNQLLWANRRNPVCDGFWLRSASPAAVILLFLWSVLNQVWVSPTPPSLTVKLEDIYAERGAYGVGFIAILRNIPSHSIIQDALTTLGCMEHRGGCSVDNNSGDGAGIMTRIPW